MFLIEQGKKSFPYRVDFVMSLVSCTGMEEGKTLRGLGSGPRPTLLCKTQLGEFFQKAALETETIWYFCPYSCGQVSTLQGTAAVKKSELEMMTGTR